ncbi:transferrin-binding protein-like solute binding protein [Gallibacterium genomosp. 1]|uniref:Transferrin-binding protein B C-lobe/N-lobe beta-barrel domain-containing protein n=1 Tax=Gallibacterium genomosp. 1 TaxID=155515 RepID=A0A0A2Y6N4_9PAST|nr:transferrin-binding protein-like solute binding protein [Gallibacterium genomosp. 1]KGQ38792.1 hypothetical protein JP36_02270 [Gallibacterium genomosp. 1]
MKQKTFFQLSTITLACAALMACSSSSNDSPAKPSSEAQLQQQLDNAKTKLAKVKQQLSVVQADVNQHQQSLTQTSQQLTQTKQQLTKAQSDVKQLSGAVSAREAEVSRLTQEMAELVEVQKLGDSDDIQQKISQTQQALEKANSSLSEAQNQLTNAEKQSDSLKKTVAELESKKKSLSTQITQKQAQLSQLTAQVTAAEQALDKEKSQLKQLTPDNPIVEAHTEENYMGDQYKWRSIKFDERGNIEQGSISQYVELEHSVDGITGYLNLGNIDFSQYSVNSQQIQTMGKARFVNQTYSTYFMLNPANDDKPVVGYIFKELPQDNSVWNRPLDKAIVTYQGKVLGYKEERLDTTDVYSLERTFKPTQGDITLKANFAKNTVFGVVTNRSGYDDNRDLDLEETRISEINSQGYIGFSGHIGNSTDYYEGVFVGPKAEEVVGFIKSSTTFDGDQVFGASSK